MQDKRYNLQTGEYTTKTVLEEPLVEKIDTLGSVNERIDVVEQNKVDTVDGKGLSTNDYTNEDNVKVEGMRYEKEYHITSDCIGCGLCETACPVDAITGVEDGQYVIDTDICINCGDCMAVCPVVPNAVVENEAVFLFEDTEVATAFVATKQRDGLMSKDDRVEVDKIPLMTNNIDAGMFGEEHTEPDISGGAF